MMKRRQTRILTRAIRAYTEHLSATGQLGKAQKKGGPLPKAYVGFLSTETDEHVWLNGVVQWNGDIRTVAIPRRNILEQEYV